MLFPDDSQTQRLLGLVAELLVTTPNPNRLKAYQGTCYVDRSLIAGLRDIMVTELGFPEGEVRKRLERIKKERRDEQNAVRQGAD